MAKTPVRENEALDEALRRFKRQVNKSGVLQEARKREFYLKPGLKRKLKSKEAFHPGLKPQATTHLQLSLRLSFHLTHLLSLV